ncbi:putative leucine-rich repeat-containing protein DDB_G0290503 isoform X1 [Phlebotomus argentipes]|uniref:putative leucine-rich repeat-containing protein DDB_G0290503 isoform X1 n=1 Tax=Phlebotomus argentipes TaxID=94469 RepID=UPI00289378E8|nr:putative leucine-rich repeat-containing protein DDB_G0290503 isoform X1 [Phlebotomus argentipes]
MNQEEKEDQSEVQEDPCADVPDVSALGVIDIFTSLYQDKIKYIDKKIGNDNQESLKVKLPVYKQWVEDLTVQNRELVKAVEEVETVVSDRLNLLEERLKKEYKLHDRRVFQLEHDIQNLLIFLRRIVRDSNYSTEGLKFHDTDLEKSLTELRHGEEPDVARVTVEMTPETSRIITGGLEDISKGMTNIRDDFRGSTSIHTFNDGYKSFEENAILREKLESTQRELNLLQMKNRELEKAASDTQVLVEEIAMKHDMIQKMRSDYGLLEEQMRQAGMQIHFKDDVIRELRREITALKKINTHESDSTDSLAVDLSNDGPSKQTDLKEMSSRKNLQDICNELNQLNVELGLTIPDSDDVVVPETEMLSAIKHEFFNLRKTNSLLRVENAEMHGEMAQIREQLKNFSSQNDRLSKQGKQLDEMQQVITKIRNVCKSFGGNQEEAGSNSDLLTSFSAILEELKRENAMKEENIQKQRLEIENLSTIQNSLKAEAMKNKEVINELKSAIDEHVSVANEQKSANEDLLCRLKEMENHQPNEIFAKLLADKNRLEVECHHQMTTISNLKSAVENMKKDGKPVSPGGQQSGSLWSWWRSVHDV